MKTLLKILPALLSLLLVSCIGETAPGQFMSDNTVRLEISGVTVFSYDESTCQLSFNETRWVFRAFTDTMLDYFEVQLQEIPGRVGDKTTATVRWSTDSGERSKENITLEARAIKGDVIWLCDESRHTAAVVRVLE